MREHPQHVTLDLSGGRWSLLVAALQYSRSEYENRARAAVDSLTVNAAVNAVRELSEFLAIIDPEGERQEIEFVARMMYQRRDDEQGTR